MKYKKILVTGAGGFIGKHMVNLLLKEGFDVIAISKRPFHILGAQCIQADFTDKKTMDELLEGIDAVFHFAAIVGVDYCRNNPDEVINVNYKKACAFIDLCVQKGIKKFIFSSSSEVYGNSTKIPFEETDALTPATAYGKSKVLTEEYLKHIAASTSMKVGVVRLFNIYGPGQREDFVIPIFIKSAITNKPIIIQGDGKQVRCFTFVEDAVKGLLLVLNYDKANFETFNIGRDNPNTIKQLSSIVTDLLPQSKSVVTYIPYGEQGVRTTSQEIYKRIPSVQKAKRLLKFQAATSLKDGVSKMIKAGIHS